MSSPRVLHLGSGKRYRQGAVNVDVTADTNPDVVHDLDVVPWPFADGAFDEVHAYDVLEHLADAKRTFEELHRVCAHGAVIHFTVPHFSSDGAYTDPTHRQFFGARSFDYFTSEHDCAFYTRARFEVLRRQVVFRKTLLNKVVHRVANRFVAAWEERWAWVFPAWFLYFELRVLKPVAQPDSARSQEAASDAMASQVKRSS